MKIKILFALLFVLTNLNAQVNSVIVGKWKLNLTITTEFTTTDDANKQVAENQNKYAFLEDSKWAFHNKGLFEVKLKTGKVEKGKYTAREDRFIVIFDNQDMEEFNSTMISEIEDAISISFGRGMTKLNFFFSKK